MQLDADNRIRMHRAALDVEFQAQKARLAGTHASVHHDLAQLNEV
jgi:hypothetical protein